MVKISVVIPTFNSANSLDACLDSIKKQSVAPFEIVVVDDASTDDTVACFGTRTDLRLVRRTKQGGAGAARADGVAAAKGEVIAFIDSDCEAKVDWLARLTTHFDMRPELGAVGGCYTHREVPSTIALFCKLEEEYGHHFSAQIPDIAPLTGGNMAVRKKVWDMARSGRELIHFARVASTEDSVLSVELRAVAPTFYDPEIVVYHRPKNALPLFVRRNIVRGKMRMIGSLNGLVGDDNVVNFFGGTRLILSTFILAAVPLPLIAAFFWNDLTKWFLIGSALLLAGHAILAHQFFAFVAQSRYHEYGVNVGLVQNIALRLLLILRTASWGIGGLKGICNYVVDRIGRQLDVIFSVMHFWRPGRISKLFYFVTSKCNARCSFCFNLDNVINWKERQKVELTLDEVRQMTSNFGRLPYLTMSGGEPFSRVDLPDVVAAFYENSKTRWVTIPTNGALTKRVVEDVRQILIKCPRIFLTIQFSVDSMHKLHDESRKISGGFDAMLQTGRSLGLLRRYYPNLRIQINTPYDTFNLDKIEEIRAFCRQNIDFDQHLFYMFRQDGVLIADENAHLADNFVDFISRNDSEEIARKPDRIWARAVRALQSVTYTDIRRIKKFKEFIRPCVATQKFTTLYDDGTFTPCEVLSSRQIGNIRDFGYDFYKMKRAVDLNTLYRKEIIDTKCNCEWMCATPINMLYDPKTWLKIALNFFRPASNLGHRTP